ncbi:hypothetical protein [Lysinibacillus odysseyi]|uniref:Uncharacterized protein n=1 Tax=Lysinibacillus odysseyi 34hs-1 = NBRC 100172 TaxID=1220589 RepID=A0A0A3JHB0_9BACI|nr:hypothetical protein [Lysinibacillus odysseyi]KGR86397.1 hypothetical protein CD32_05770 [Lysinibacillus odysseyi 34hs-1 = NBRC 100172]
MPIKADENIQVVFGTGDIQVKIGGKKGCIPGVVQFVENEQLPIGAHIYTDETIMKINDAPISLIFHKTESLDAVIYQLQKLRTIMDAE